MNKAQLEDICYEKLAEIARLAYEIGRGENDLSEVLSAKTIDLVNFVTHQCYSKED